MGYDISARHATKLEHQHTLLANFGQVILGQCV
jgi:hypothetical protein